jgi:hypothetical protein
VDLRVTVISAATKLSNTTDRTFVKNVMMVKIPEEGTVINFLNSVLIRVDSVSSLR